MNVVLLNDTDGRENIGCRLTSSTLKRQLVAGLSRTHPSVELAPFPWGFGKGGKTGRVWRSGRPWMSARGVAADPAGFADWLARLAGQQYGGAAVRAALEADLVICHPEGSISDYHDAVRILNLLSLPLLACVKGIPTFTMNGTFPLYPAEDRRYRLIHAFLRACPFAALRDRITARHYGVSFMPDSAVMHELSGPPPGAESRPFVLVTTGAHVPKRLNLALAREALRFCDENRLRPLVLTKKHQDLRALKAEVLARGGHFVETATLEEAERWIGQCALHIGGRYHMALFGLLLDVPSVLVLTNTHKNRWLSEDFSGVALIEKPEEVRPAAIRLLGGQAPDRDAMRRTVRTARDSFDEGLRQAAEQVRAGVPRGAGADALNARLCVEIAEHLRPSDALSFWLFGLRLGFRNRA